MINLKIVTMNLGSVENIKNPFADCFENGRRIENITIYRSKTTPMLINYVELLW